MSYAWVQMQHWVTHLPFKHQSPPYTWLANIKSSTPVIFTMVNTLEKQGGSSNAQVVGYSNNSTCLPSGHNGLLNGAITGIIITLIILIFGIISSFSSYEAGESPTTQLTSITTSFCLMASQLNIK